MATRGRRSSFSSSQSSSESESESASASASASLISSSMAKRHLGLENPGKAMAAKPQLGKKRPALADLTNQRNGPPNAPWAAVVSKKPMGTCFQRANQPAVSITASSEFEYIDNDDALAVNSTERKACSNLNLNILDPEGIAGNICKRDIPVEIKTVDRVVGIDDNVTDPQLCAAIACEIYKNLQASERKKMPRTDYVERIQKDINASMRAILIDWLVEVAEEYSLVPETLFLTVNYIDRYLSGNVIQRQRLQLLGVACMMIAAKYEEICAPQVEEFCYVADNTYFKKEVLQMESSVLNYLKFEMSAPTAGCFLTWFVRAAQGINEDV